MDHNPSRSRTLAPARLALAAGLAITAAANAQFSTPAAPNPADQSTWITLDANDWNNATSTLNINNAAQRVLNYGDSVRVLATAALADDLANAGFQATTKPATFDITLAGQTFDPLAGIPNAPRGLAAAPDDGSQQLRMIQYAGPMKDTWMNRLEQAGVRIISYIYPHTYIVWADADQIDAASAGRDNAVRWSGQFAPAFKIRPEFRNRNANPVKANILLTNHADTHRAIDELRAAGAERIDDVRPLNDALSVVRVVIQGNNLESLATINAVYSVQIQQTDGGLRGELTSQLAAGRVDSSGLAFPGYQNFLNDINLDGSGVTVAIVDGGVSNSHPDLNANMIGCVGTSCGGSATDDHGTHVAGIVGGNGLGATTDGGGFNRALGVAPGVSFVEQLYSPYFQSAGGMRLLMEDSFRSNAVISQNSWGPAGTPQGYDAQTLEVDLSVRDADRTAPGNQPLTYVLSIMNGSGDGSSSNLFSSLGSPDEAKNLIGVGSQKGQTSSLAQDTGYPDLSSNSAHGPALDGRTLPHIVAPGCDVDSADTTFSGSDTYGLKCGTSMASPHVSGAAALFVEQYRIDNNGADPSPALIKAAVGATADSLEGFNDADGRVMGPVFDRFQGYGGLNTAALVREDGSTQNYWDQEVVFDQTGDSWTTSLTPTDPSKPMRVMLVWTDAPGHGLGGTTPAWNNDLDLVVQSGAGTYLGNNFGPGSVSVTGGTADFQNNTEAVYLPAGSGGATVTVNAANINSDGIPGVGDATDQDFALFCVNCDTGPGVSLAIDGPDQICTPADAVYSINSNATGGFSGDVQLTINGLDPALNASIVPSIVSAGDAATLTISGTGNLADGDYEFSVVATEINPSGDPITGSAGESFKAFDGAPAATAGLAPASGTNGVSLSPTLEWNPQNDAAEYELQLAAAGSNFADPIESALVENGSDYNINSILEPGTDYEWRVRATNPCGDGSWTAAAFTTRVTPPVLLVDDDDNNPNLEDTYADALANIGIDFDVWDTQNSDNEPDLATLATYDAVVWFTGDEFGGAAGPGASAEAALTDYVAQGGSLLLSSQDYIYDRLGFNDPPSSFMQNILGVGSFDQDENQTSVTGSGTYFSSIGSQSLSYGAMSNFSDVLEPTASAAEIAFTGNQGNAAVAKISDQGSVVFTGFPLAALPQNALENTLQAFLDATITPVCPGDTNGDSTVGLDDLLTVLANFGLITDDGDVDNTGGVDLNDLLLVLSNFGNSC